MSHDNLLFIGIDNGLSGGLCALSSHGGQIIAKAPMPVLERGRETEIDGAAVVKWLANVIQMQDATITVEACPPHAQQKSTMRSMGISYGILIGAISAKLPWCKLQTVRSGNPKDSWQKIMFGQLGKGETKNAAIAKATELWPDEVWTTTPRSTVPHSGIVDAALIAEHSRRQRL